MRAPLSPSLAASRASQLDFCVAIISIFCMTTGFWRLWPGAVGLEQAPIGALVLQAGIAALGFVGIATRWEVSLRALSVNPTPLVLLLLACASPLWASTPTDALRNAILLVVVWGFGMALSLRFRARDLAELCAIAGLLGLAGQFLAVKGQPPLSALDGDLAFTLLSVAWAVWLVPQRRALWLVAMLLCTILAFFSLDTTALGAGLGMLLGLGLAKAGNAARRGGPVAVLVTAWAIVACLLGVTAFALFGAQAVALNISDFFFALGDQSVLGQGFGNSGHSVSDAIGGGLGIVGVFTALLVAFATLFQALLAKSDGKPSGEAYVAVWFGAMGAMAANPSEISVFGPVWVVLAMATFAISLKSVAKPQVRLPLMERNKAAHRGANSGPVMIDKRASNQGRRPSPGAPKLRPRI